MSTCFLIGWCTQFAFMFCFCSPCSPHTSVGPECMACVSRTSTHFNLLQAVLSRIMSIRIIRIVFEPLRRPPVITSTVFDPLNSANIFFCRSRHIQTAQFEHTKNQKFNYHFDDDIGPGKQSAFQWITFFCSCTSSSSSSSLFFFWLTSFKPSN